MRPSARSVTRAMVAIGARAVLVFGGSRALACAPPPPGPPAPVVVRVSSDSGEAIEGAEILQGSTPLARTNREGVARLDVGGREGASFLVQVRCPVAYRSPVDPVEVRRVDLSPGGKLPEYAVRCARLRHVLVVAVHAQNGANLPVLYLGREVARTDAFGAAHVSFDMDVHDRVELTLQTAGPDAEKLHPQNPSSVFEMPDHDDVQIFAATFTRDAPKKPPPGPPPKTIRNF